MAFYADRYFIGAVCTLSYLSNINKYSHKLAPNSRSNKKAYLTLSRNSGVCHAIVVHCFDC